MSDFISELRRPYKELRAKLDEDPYPSHCQKIVDDFVDNLSQGDLLNIFSVASGANDDYMLECLVKKIPNVDMESGKTTALETSIINNALRASIFLVNNGANLNRFSTVFKNTPLHLAISSSNFLFIREFFGKFNLTLRDNRGRTPYELAVEHKKAMEVMSSSGPSSISCTEKFWDVDEKIDKIVELFPEKKRANLKKIEDEEKFIDDLRRKHGKKEDFLDKLKNRVAVLFN